jgi:hypothetical protein
MQGDGQGEQRGQAGGEEGAGRGDSEQQGGDSDGEQDEAEDEEEDEEEESSDDVGLHAMEIDARHSRADGRLGQCRLLPVLLPPLAGALAGEVNALTRGSNLRHKVAAVSGRARSCAGGCSRQRPAARPACPELQRRSEGAARGELLPAPAAGEPRGRHGRQRADPGGAVRPPRRQRPRARQQRAPPHLRAPGNQGAG